MNRTPGEAGLVRALGVWGLAASVVNITIGGGIFRVPGTNEVTGRLGAAAPLAYALCALAMTFVVLCFAEAGSRVALTGGPYAYVERAFGGFAAFAIGWLLWVTCTIATAAVATIFADSVQRMFPEHPLTHGRTTILALVFGLVAAINVLGVQLGARLNIASTIAKLVPLAILIVVGLMNIDPANVRITTLPSTGELSRASVFLIFVFAGIESALVPSGEVREPSRTVPRAVILALVIVTIVYILVQVAAQGVLGASLVGRSAPLADVAETIMGPVGGTLLGIGVIMSTFGYLSGMILAAPRALFAFARDGILPTPLASVHPRFRTPWIAIIVQAALCLALALTNQFERLAILANVSVLIVYLGCAAAAWWLRRRDVNDNLATALKPIPGSGVAPFLAVIVIVLLLTSITRHEWAVVGICAGVGLALWLFSSLQTRWRDASALRRVQGPGARP